MNGLTPEAADLSTSGSIFTIALGGEYMFTPPPVTPYLSLDLQFNSIGSRNFTVTTSSRSQKRSIDGFSRFGFGLGGGIDFKVMSQLDVDAGVAFNDYNAFGQGSNEGNITGITLSISFLYHPL